jgi:hypothetical protein
MPYVMVDTNCLMRDYLLIGANLQTFRSLGLAADLPAQLRKNAVGTIRLSPAPLERRRAGARTVRLGEKLSPLSGRIPIRLGQHDLGPYRKPSGIFRRAGIEMPTFFLPRIAYT